MELYIGKFVIIYVSMSVTFFSKWTFLALYNLGYTAVWGSIVLQWDQGRVEQPSRRSYGVSPLLPTPQELRGVPGGLHESLKLRLDVVATVQASTHLGAHVRVFQLPQNCHQLPIDTTTTRLLHDFIKSSWEPETRAWRCSKGPGLVTYWLFSVIGVFWTKFWKQYTNFLFIVFVNEQRGITQTVLIFLTSSLNPLPSPQLYTFLRKGNSQIIILFYENILSDDLFFSDWQTIPKYLRVGIFQFILSNKSEVAFIAIR